MRTKTIIEFFKEYRSLLIILLIGIIIRLWQINWGLPELFEEATPLTISWKFWNWGTPGFDFNPHFFHYPALTFYIQFIAQVIHFSIGNLIGIYPSLDTFGLSPAPLIITGRLVDVVFDILTILIIYKIARELWDHKTGLIAAILLIVNPLHVMLAHQIQVDTILTFFCTAALLHIIRAYKSGNRKSFLLAGLLIGLAASSKYTGFFLLFTLVGAHLLRSHSIQEMIRSLNHPPLYLAILLCVLVFFCLNPFIILSPTEFQQDFSFEQAHITAGHLGIDASKSTFDFYVLNVLPSVHGSIGLVLGIGIIIFAFIQKKRQEIVVAIFPIVYLIIISTWEMRAERYILPAIPFLILFTAYGISTIGDYVWKKLYSSQNESVVHSRKHVIYAAIVIVLSIQPIYKSAKYLHELSLPDTRILTKNWIKGNIPAGSFIVTGPYGIDFPDSSYRIIQIPFIAVQAELAAPFYDSRWYVDADILIASSFDRDRYAMDPERYGEFLPYYDSLNTRWRKVFEAAPNEGQSGPTLWLFAPSDSLRRHKFDLSLFERLDGNPESTRISNFLKDINSLLLQKKQFAKSEQLLRMILMNEGTNILIRNQLARVLYDLGNYNGALVQLQQSVQIDKNQPEVFALAGSSLLRIERHGEAEVALISALSLNNRIESAYTDLIELYTRQRENTKLLDILKRYYSILNPRTEDAKKVKERIDNLQKGRKK